MTPQLARLLLALAFAAAPTVPLRASDNLKCKIGPVERTYGSSKWLVYSCDDRLSLVFVSAPGEAVFPFYFFRMKDKVHGEGTGDKKATDAAFAEIGKIDDQDAAALVRATLAVGSQK